MRLANHFFAIILLSLGLLLTLSDEANAQRFTPPNGEYTVAKIIPSTHTKTGQSTERVVATSKSIYYTSPKYNEDGLITGWLPDKCVWKAPEGRSIVAMAEKLLRFKPDDKYFKLYVEMIVLLDNGDVFLVEIGKLDLDENHTYRLTKGIKLERLPNSGGSQTYLDAIGDDIYVLSTSAVYVTRDMGASWVFDTLGFNGAKAVSIGMDSSQNVYAATNKGLFSQPLISSTWTKMSFPTSGALTSVFVDRRDVLFVSAGSDAYESSDRGNNWTSISAGLQQPIVKWGDNVYGDIFAITSDRQLYVRKSGGTWSTAYNALNQAAGEPTDGTSLLRANDAGGDSIAVAATNFGLYHSTDRGDTWIASNESIPAETFFGLVAGAGGNLVASTSQAVFRTNIADTAWTKTFPAQGHLAGVLLEKGGSNYFAYKKSTGANFVMRSSNTGQTWQPDTLGLSSIDFGGFAADENGGQHAFSSRYGSSFTGMIYEKKPGKGWTADSAGFQPATNSYGTAIVSDGAGNIYVSGVFPGGAKVMRRSLAAPGWTADITGIPSNINFFNRFVPAPNGIIYASSGDNIYVRKNASWSPVASPPVSGSITAMCTDASGALFAAYRTFSGIGKGIYYTTDDGANWTFAGFDHMEVFVLSSEGNDVYAASSTGIYKLGTTTTATYQLEMSPSSLDFGDVTVGDSSVKSFTIHNTGTLFEDLTPDVFNDPSFKLLSDPLDLASGESTEVFVQFKPASAGQFTSSLDIYSPDDPKAPYKVPVMGRGVTAGVVGEPKDVLLKIVPNPFAEKAELRYILESPGSTSILLRDIHGRSVKEIVGEHQLVGEHFVTITSDGLASGVYSLEVRIEGSTHKKQIVIMR